MVSRIPIVADKEIDWFYDYSVYGLNLSTMQFENVSFIPKDSIISLNLFYNAADYSEDVAELAKNENATFLLYTEDKFVVGFVVEP